MKFILSCACVALAFSFFGCSEKSNDFYGKWTGESLTFTVESAGQNQVKIVNENGTLNGEIVEGKIVGKNELGMSFEMTVKGDSAYYTFADITTGYKRVK